MKNFDLDELPTPKTICESTAAMTNAKAEEKARILYNKLIKDVGVSLIQEFVTFLPKKAINYFLTSGAVIFGRFY